MRKGKDSILLALLRKGKDCSWIPSSQTVRISPPSFPLSGICFFHSSCCCCCWENKCTFFWLRQFSLFLCYRLPSLLLLSPTTSFHYFIPEVCYSPFTNPPSFHLLNRRVLFSKPISDHLYFIFTLHSPIPSYSILLSFSFFPFSLVCLLFIKPSKRRLLCRHFFRSVYSSSLDYWIDTERNRKISCVSLSTTIYILAYLGLTFLDNHENL